MGAGVYGWAAADVADVAVRTVRADCREHPGLDLVRFVLFSDRLLTAFASALGDPAP